MPEEKRGGGTPLPLTPPPTATTTMPPPSLPCGKTKKKWISRNKMLQGGRDLIIPGEKVKVVEGNENNDKSKDKLTCPFCEKKFGSSSNLVKHKRSHTGERPFPCCHCEKRFISKFDLERHSIIHGEGKGGFLCDICDKKFTTKESLVIHSRVHTGEMPFQCDTCQRKFPSQSGLNRHTLCHSEQKEFLCHECGKMFNTKQSMRIHLTTHNVERNFNCDHCRMRFKRALDLKRHRLTHKEIPTLLCPLPECDHQFRRKDNLLRHLQLTHNQSRETAKETANLLCLNGKMSEMRSERTVDSETVISSSDLTMSESTQSSCITEVSEASSSSKKRRKSKTRNKSPKQKTRGKAKSSKQLTQQNTQQLLLGESKDDDIRKHDSQSQIQKAMDNNQNQEDSTTSGNSKRSYRTASVICLAKSTTPSSSIQHFKSRHRKNELLDEAKISSPPPEEGNTFSSITSSIPYPMRIPSPGQEYINYLNSLNNPYAYSKIVREKMSSTKLQYEAHQRTSNTDEVRVGIGRDIQHQFLQDSSLNFDSRGPSSSSHSFTRDIRPPPPTYLNCEEAPPPDSSDSSYRQMQRQEQHPVRHEHQVHDHPVIKDNHILYQNEPYFTDYSSVPPKQYHNLDTRIPNPAEGAEYSNKRVVAIPEPYYESQTSSQTYPLYCPRTERSSVPNPPQYYQNDIAERPANLTVIRRASDFQNNSDPHHHHLTVHNSASSFHPHQHQSENQGLQFNMTPSGSPSIHENGRLHNGKDMIINRDPRKNFLQKNLNPYEPSSQGYS